MISIRLSGPGLLGVETRAYGEVGAAPGRHDLPSGARTMLESRCGCGQPTTGEGRPIAGTSSTDMAVAACRCRGLLGRLGRRQTVAVSRACGRRRIKVELNVRAIEGMARIAGAVG